MGVSDLVFYARSAMTVISGRAEGVRHQGSRRDKKIKRSRGGRWSWTFKLAQEEIMSREVELCCEKLDFFRFELLLNSSATDVVLVTLAKHGS